jgi:hypothetical protein
LYRRKNHFVDFVEADMTVPGSAVAAGSSSGSCPSPAGPRMPPKGLRVVDGSRRRRVGDADAGGVPSVMIPARLTAARDRPHGQHPRIRSHSTRIARSAHPESQAQAIARPTVVEGATGSTMAASPFFPATGRVSFHPDKATGRGGRGHRRGGREGVRDAGCAGAPNRRRPPPHPALAGTDPNGEVILWPRVAGTTTPELQPRPHRTGQPHPVPCRDRQACAHRVGHRQATAPGQARGHRGPDPRRRRAFHHHARAGPRPSAGSPSGSSPGPTSRATRGPAGCARRWGPGNVPRAHRRLVTALWLPPRPSGRTSTITTGTPSPR